MNPLNGLDLRKARNVLCKGIYALIGGLYKDEFWLGPKKVWDWLNANGIDYAIMAAKYRHNAEGVPCAKEWHVAFEFTDHKGKPQTISGVLTAHGAGSVRDPLDAYDMTMPIN